MGSVVVRPAQIDDAPGIAAVHVKTWQSAYRGQMPDDYLDSLSIEKRAERWHNILADLGVQEQVFVAELDEHIAGFCSVGKSRDDDAGAGGTIGELYAIYVDPQRMHQGVGSALMHAGQAHLIEQGFERATLWVLETNQRARRFYENHGWRADGTRKTENGPNFVLHELRYAITYAGS
ncbi:MAG: GNAT family N-acetyltransferase [Caldilineaceae bacterium]|nr:GNAT family N-acetyltransferase [Caldilineaceae bacterium]